MSLYDYKMSIKLSDAPFYGLIMAAMRGADTNNLEKLKRDFPDIWDELYERYHAPGGMLPSDPGYGVEERKANEEDAEE